MMRTTVDIPDELYKDLKMRALAQGNTVKQLLLQGAEAVLREPVEKPVRRLRAPLVTGGEPGSLKIDNEKIYDLIDFP